jgi:uncharacterized protein (DUF302 family)
MPAQTIARQKYGFSKVIPLPFASAMEKAKQALMQQGFGVLAEIDIRKAMKEKLNVEYPNYTILGACNPQLAHRALQAEPRLGLLLPCNVTVREVEAGTEVAVVDADAMLSVVENQQLQPVADEASKKFNLVLEAI